MYEPVVIPHKGHSPYMITKRRKHRHLERDLTNKMQVFLRMLFWYRKGETLMGAKGGGQVVVG